MAFNEEVVYRGLAFRVLSGSVGWPVAAATTAIIFSLLHGITSSSVGLVGYANLFLAGWFFTMLYIATRSLWAPIGLHTMWNLSQTFFSEFFVEGSGMAPLESFFGVEGWPLTLVVMLVVAGLATAGASRGGWARWTRGVGSAIYAGHELVGFIMTHEEPDEVFLWRFMIAGQYQRRGYGKGAIQLLVHRLREQGTKELLTSCVQAEDGPMEFYRRLGFEATDTMVGDERVMRLEL